MAATHALPFHFPPPQAGQVDVLIVAGEHSGDQQAAVMVRDFRARNPGASVCALGGEALAAAGAQLLFDLTHSSVVGLVEVLRNYGFFRQIFQETLRWIDEYQPRAICFVDYPGFNLRLARTLFERGRAAKAGGPFRLLYYISPQIWAWKSKRRFAMARHLDALAVIFPFEVDCYNDTDMDVRFVGHPFVRPDYRLPVAWDKAGPVLLLAGSRSAAVGRIAPVLLAGFQRYRETHPGASACMIYPTETLRRQLEKILQRFPSLAGAVTFAKTSERVIGASAVLTSSGTMSLNCALAGIPGAIAYRANPFTYRMGRLLVRVPYLGIANLLLNEPMYPEYIQNAATPDRLAAEIAAARESDDRRNRVQEQARQLRSILAEPPRGDAAGWLAEQLRVSADRG